MVQAWKLEWTEWTEFLLAHGTGNLDVESSTLRAEGVYFFFNFSKSFSLQLPYNFHNLKLTLVLRPGGLMVWVRTLAGYFVLCSWARHFTLTVPLSTQVYKWIMGNLMLGNLMLGLALRWTSISSKGEIPSHFML